MTDKTEPTVIRGAKISFKPVRDYPADAQTLSYYAMRARIAADFYQRWIDGNFNIRVISVCGYNPQKLLPAPSFEREFLQSFAEWAYSQMGNVEKMFRNVYKDTPTRDGEVTYHAGGSVSMADATWRGPGRGFEPYPYQEAAMRRLGVDVERWNEPDATPLDDLQRWKDSVADFGDLETKMVLHMYTAFDFETNGPRSGSVGRIEIFDYDDGTVINLEGEGELPGNPDIVDDLFSGEFARRMSESFARTKLEQRPAPRKSYLDHDPTKQHKRRKKK